MKVLVTFCIIVLCFNVLRFVIGVIPILLGKKVADLKEPMPWKLRIVNLVETTALVFATVVLILNYYKS